MKPKIITGNEVVGWYCFLGTIAPKQYNTLSEEEREDYLTDDDERKYIYIRFSDFLTNDDIEMYYDKKDLIESLIEETTVKIERAKKEIELQNKLLSTLTTKRTNYYQQLGE